MEHREPITECEKMGEVANQLHPNWKRWLFWRIKKLLNITDNYPYWFNRKGKYYDIVDGDFVKKQKTF